MMNIKAVLLDVIGTTILEAKSSLIADCFKNAFKQHHVEATDADIISIRGKDKMEAIKLVLINKNNASVNPSAILDSFKTCFKNNLHQFSEDHDLNELIPFLKSKKIYVGVGSGLPEDLFQMLFDYFQWSRFNFDYVGVGENVGRGRPHPDMINDMCRKLNVNNQELLKIGDTPSDVEEGKNAGAFTVAVLRGTVPDYILLESKPDFVIRSLHEVKTIL